MTMKKIYLALPLLALAMTACDPSEIDLGSPDGSVSASTLESMITITQVDENGNPASDGNYFNYTTSPAQPVQIFNYNADGKEISLAHGPKGSFSIIPKRGQDPAQTFYVRVANHDGSMTEISKTYNVYVPTELSKGMKLLASNSGTKIWTWNPEAPDGVVWGNMGYCGGAGADAVATGKWWGVTSEEEFLTQPQHCADGFIGDQSMEATMVFNEDGSIKCYDAEGRLIREGSYSVENFNDSDPSAWKVGDLMTSAGAILWPYQINWADNGLNPYPTQFDIVYLSPTRMTLVYPDGGAFDGLGGWGEATFWQFKSTSDTEGIFAGYDEGNAWTWNPEAVDGVVWGNMGYCGGAGANAVATGKWWGVTSEEEFGGQLQHSAVGALTGEESFDAYMIFKEDGSLKKYDANGKLLNDGTFSIEKIVGNDWKVAELTTSDGAILWPYQINWADNGLSPYPDKYEVVYLSGDKMTLVYPDGGAFDGLGGWGEATFWQFKRK
jgi:hypothetical protein